MDKDARWHTRVVSARRTKYLFASSSIAGEGRGTMRRKDIGNFVFELLRTPLTGVLCQYTSLRRRANTRHFVVVEVGDVMQNITIICRKQDFAIRFKERIEARPIVRDDRCAAGSGFEQSHRR